MLGLLGTAAAALSGAGLGFSLRFNWWRPKRPGTPVLMYHEVGPHRAGSRLNHWRVLPEDFARQMALLARRGYRGVALRDLLDGQQASGGKPVVLTFDDGYEGVLTRALPVLRSHGFSATVFVVSGKTGGVNDWDGETPGDVLLSEEGVRALHAAGIEIGSHGATHRALPSVSDAELDDEVRGSKAALEAMTAAPVVSFCYPYGAFDDRSVAAVRGAGYRAATVIRGGIVSDLSDPFRLKRVAVRGTNTLLDFSLALTRGRSRL
ncbi:MAG TPA: polysaccharide deacetylase family protein [Thermoanaerobaculia bacterium]|nr:polysaccharide deacetylase family protein [Thermoanaerobaculia bacterium]